MASDLYVVPGRTWIRFQPQRDRADLFFCWRPHEICMQESREQVLKFAGDRLDASQLKQLSRWLEAVPAMAAAPAAECLA